LVTAALERSLNLLRRRKLLLLHFFLRLTAAVVLDPRVIRCFALGQSCEELSVSIIYYPKLWSFCQDLHSSQR
jgi:hypothetical protein